MIAEWDAAETYHGRPAIGKWRATRWVRFSQNSELGTAKIAK